MAFCPTVSPASSGCAARAQGLVVSKAHLKQPVRHTRTASASTRSVDVRQRRAASWERCTFDNVRTARFQTRLNAKFEKFKGSAATEAEEGEDEAETLAEQPRSYSLQQNPADELPNSLFDAVNQAAQACALAIKKGNDRSIVELLIPELWDPISGPVMADEGDNMRWWELAREFLTQTANATGCIRTLAVFPDVGVAAMLANRWKGSGAPFACSSSEDTYLPEATDLVVITCPDPRQVQNVRKICDMAAEEGIPVVMFNPRLASGDVGIGTAVRDMRKNFVETFVVAYALRPLTFFNGSVFRKFPAQWKVIVQEQPGEYKLLAEKPRKPDSDELEAILDRYLEKQRRAEGDVDDDDEGGPSLITQVAGIAKSMQRFLKALSN